MLYDYSGIFMHEGKKALVKARLMKRIRKLGMQSFDQYLNFIDTGDSGAEFLELVDVLTTNKTSFFRENQHFEFIRDIVIPNMAGRSAKWWTAGCSTGEEPISCAITLLEEQQFAAGNSVKILATDLSREVLRTAKRGIYPTSKMTEIPGPIRNKYFEKAEPGSYRIGPALRNMITYGRLNLQENWPLKGPFHVIMCRNVMIYFDRETQRELVRNFYNILEPGGYLFLGHSESISDSKHGFTNICPAVYQK
jgi:chemotaxis protein methyltransferase CheR